MSPELAGQALSRDVVVQGNLEDVPFEARATVTMDVPACDQDGDGFDRRFCGGFDCDDRNADINPDAPELCNGLDDDCNGLADDTEDADRDGFNRCEDCNDLDPQVFPGAPERCNGLDDDCDGRLPLFEADLDGDGLSLCEGDCNDEDPGAFPGARERCNGQDDNCNGRVDDAEDGDGDGFGRCDDCDDGDKLVFPGAEELCDGVDNDCDGEIGPEEVDADGDGIRACIDCDDADASVNPAAEEVCNGIDDDCNDIIDEMDACPCERVRSGGNLYLFCEDAAPWTDARETCLDLGYDMLTIGDVEEDDFAYESLVRFDASQPWWMGFNDRRAEGRWVWEDGSAVTYTNWAPGEPNNVGAGEDCGQLNRFGDAFWNDEPCRLSYPYICELDLPDGP